MPSDSPPGSPSNTFATSVSQSACARCGAAFICGAESGAPTCWCVGLPRLQSLLPVDTCLCQACLTLALEEESNANLPHSSRRQP